MERFAVLALSVCVGCSVRDAAARLGGFAKQNETVHRLGMAL
jgi:hypothetical protein